MLQGVRLVDMEKVSQVITKRGDMEDELENAVC